MLAPPTRAWGAVVAASRATARRAASRNCCDQRLPILRHVDPHFHCKRDGSLAPERARGQRHDIELREPRQHRVAEMRAHVVTRERAGLRGPRTHSLLLEAQVVLPIRDRQVSERRSAQGVRDARQRRHAERER